MHPRVYRALATPIVGHVDPWFTEMMGDVQTLLRRVFQTQNRITFPISASGSGGIEAAVQNTLEEGEACIVCVNGAFSERMAIIADRISDKVIRVEVPYGRTVDPRRCASRGPRQENQVCRFDARRNFHCRRAALADYRKVADELDALLIVDAVATLGGMPMDVDRDALTFVSAARKKRSARLRECLRSR